MTNPQRLKILISEEIGAGANMEHAFMEMLAQRLSTLRFNVPLAHSVPQAVRQQLRPATFYQSISFDLGKKTFKGYKH